MYVLPNGCQLMASGDGSIFYATSDSGSDLIWYELNEEGQLLFRGRPTAWSADDLREMLQPVEALPLVQRTQG
jgi:hypothetical protein